MTDDESGPTIRLDCFDPADVALRLIVRRCVEELARRSGMPEDDYRATFLRVCVDDVEMANFTTAEGRSGEDARTDVLVALRAFLCPR